jgi:hypothetical protein
MKTFSRLAIASAVALACGTATVASASIITAITASGPGLGSFSINNLNNDNRTIDIGKVFDSVAPITLDFTVAHSTGNNQFDVTEAITNSTGVNWTDFHYSIIEGPNPQGQGNVFISFNNATKTNLGGFTLDQPPSSGPRNLNYTGFLADGGGTTAHFTLNAFDPGAGNTYHFQLVQTPSVTANVPEPGTWATLLAGLFGVIGLVRRRVG